ncbi:putative MFS family arabinose efflux permease [Psychrobacillus insolitus]|uniref:Putative MFS family arabinose efflux permease n=1 Tax=Psychrobacillus insolitus TaxID=1461 RepID=A0A2W7P8U7_9BACI|nr:MFS transporter [Psychrobacillus insolitus]PZX02363.1 putative MFS family arabinose efflux permease [Psychrobacillus insolitus]
MGLRGRVSLSVGWVTLFLMGTDLFIVSPLLPFISEEYNVSSAMTGWMVTVFAVTYAIAAPFFGWASDKNGRGIFITFGLLLFSFSNVLTAFSPSFTWLIISRILAGLSVAAITPLIYAIIGDIAPSNRRGTWLSIVVSGHLTALWAGAPLGILLEYFLGWRSVFVVMATLGTILAVVNFKTWKYVPRSDLTRNQLEGNLLRILGSVSVTTIWAISMYALYVYLGAALYSENRFSSSEIALAVIFYGIGAVLGSLISGQFTDRFGERKISKVTLFFLTLILICLGIFFSSGDWIYFFLFIWALVGYAGFTSYQARLAVEYPEERGIVLAWNNTALYIGITIGSIIGGYVISNWGYPFLPYFCSIVAIISFVLSTQKVQETKKESADSTDT